MMTSQVADRLVELCRKGQFDAARTELFSNHAVGAEPELAPVEEDGIDAEREEGRHFVESVEDLHRIVVSEPMVVGNFFTVSMALDTTSKGCRQVTMEELCVYKVEGGKIVSGQFFGIAD